MGPRKSLVNGRDLGEGNTFKIETAKQLHMKTAAAAIFIVYAKSGMLNTNNVKLLLRIRCSRCQQSDR